MKRFLLCVLCAVALGAQSISITQPASGELLATTPGYQFSVSRTFRSVGKQTKVLYGRLSALESVARRNVFKFNPTP
ncbi:MAG: hypothetical protein ABSH31_04680 [Bryobacteraceae bacterium]|jgi:hypothetical protein